MSWNTARLKWRQVYKDLMYLGAKVLQLYGKDVLTKGFMVRVCCILVRQLLKGKFSVWARHGSKEKFRGKQASEIQSLSWLILSLNSLQFQALSFFYLLAQGRQSLVPCHATTRAGRLGFSFQCSKAGCRRPHLGQPQVGLFTPSQDGACFFSILSPIFIIKTIR